MVAARRAQRPGGGLVRNRGGHGGRWRFGLIRYPLTFLRLKTRKDDRMTWKVTSALLAALLLWTCAALVRVENQLYALQVGMCPAITPLPVPDLKCLKSVETRTGWWWHLYYALLP